MAIEYKVGDWVKNIPLNRIVKIKYVDSVWLRGQTGYSLFVSNCVRWKKSSSFAWKDFESGQWAIICYNPKQAKEVYARYKKLNFSPHNPTYPITFCFGSGYLGWDNLSDKDKWEERNRQPVYFIDYLKIPKAVRSAPKVEEEFEEFDFYNDGGKEIETEDCTLGMEHIVFLSAWIQGFRWVHKNCLNDITFYVTQSMQDDGDSLHCQLPCYIPMPNLKMGEFIFIGGYLSEDERKMIG